MREKEPSFGEKFFERKRETRVLTETEREIVRKKIEEEIQKLEERSPQFREEVKRVYSEIENLKCQGKIERLLELAKEKSVFFAIKVAQETKDPYLLDTLHDILAYKGYFKNLLKRKLERK